MNLDDVLLPARQGRYAVGLFNVVTMEMVEGVFQAACELNAPLIIGTAEAFLPYLSMEAVADMLLARARRARIPVVVHFDHGKTFARCMQALRLGFSSVMFDGSALPYEENVARAAEVVRVAHAMGATVEGELGSIGGMGGGDGAYAEGSLFTDPLQARDYVKRTGTDALASAVVNEHGAYKAVPKLDFARIALIAAVVSLPRVLP